MPGCAICQRISSIRKNPNSMKHSAVKPYWMPMTLWSVEKMYLLPETRLVVLVMAVVVVRVDAASASRYGGNC